MSQGEPDAGAILRNWATLSMEVAPRASPVMLLVRASAAADPQMRDLWDRMARQRLDRMAHNAGRLLATGQVRAGLSLDAVRDVLYAYTSPELYEMLVLQRRLEPGGVRRVRPPRTARPAPGVRHDGVVVATLLRSRPRPPAAPRGGRPAAPGGAAHGRLARTADGDGRARRLRQDHAARRVARGLPPGAPAVAWLSLDGRDDDPALFWTYVVTAIRTRGRRRRRPGAAAARGVPGGHGGGDRRCCSTTWAGCREDLLLVLDDYHLVEAAAVHGAGLPPRAPAAPAARRASRRGPTRRCPWRACARGGELVEVRAADLRFTAEESAAYLDGSMGLRLGGGDVAALDGRTEGWIAALQLAALSMQGRDDVGAFIAGFAGDDRYVVDYLVEEVLARQPAEVREFLLATRCSSGSPARCATPSPDGPAAGRRWWRSSARTCSSSRSTTGGSGTGTTTCSPTCCAPTCSTSSPTWSPSCTGAPATGSRPRRHARRRSATRWPAATPSGPPTSWSSPCWRCAGTGGRRSSPGGCARCPTTCFGAGRCSASASSARWPRCRISPRVGQATVRHRALAALGRRQLAGSRRRTSSSSTSAATGRSRPQIEMYRAALALAGGDLDGTIAHAREALALAAPDDDLTRAVGRRARPGSRRGPPATSSGAHAAYTATVAASTSAASSPTSSAAPSPSATSGAPRAGSATRCAPTSTRSTWRRRRRAPSRCAERPTCTSGSPGCCSSATTSPAPREHLDDQPASR